MTSQFLLALVGICWVLRTYSGIRPALLESWYCSDCSFLNYLGAFVAIVPQGDLHVKIEHMSFLFERLVLRVAPSWIHRYVSTCGGFRAFLNDR